MLTFIGDYPCKMDAKGRISIPSSFRRQLQSAEQDCFVVRKNIYEKCLDLFPIQEWERQLEEIRKKINVYNREHAEFLREYYRGTAQLQMDGNGRLLIPKRLSESVGLDKHVVFAGQDGKIEIWGEHEYQGAAMDQKNFMDLASDILGGKHDL